MSRRIAIITARGGSKRIPKKNIREFCGKPIIAYGIEAALKSEIFDEVMVSTDSQEIAKVAEKYGASVPFFRSEKTSNDFATTADVILEVLEEYHKRGQKFEFAACIYPTAPFVTSARLRTAMNQLEAQEGAMIMPVVRFSYPPQRGYTMNEGKLQMKWPQFLTSRSQDLEPLFHDCGQFYGYRVEQYINCKGKVIDGIIPMELDELEVQDIDNEEDWKIAEMKYKLLHPGSDEL